MAASEKLIKLLQSNLDQVDEPKNYAALRERLLSINPNHQAPKIKESPENAAEIHNLTSESALVRKTQDG